MAPPRKVKYPQPIPEDAYDAKNPGKAKRENTDPDANWSWSERPISPAYFEKLAKELETEALNNPLLMSKEGFLLKKKIHEDRWEYYLEQSEVLRKAYDFAMMVFGEKREMGMLFRDKKGDRLPEKSVMFLMHHYKKSWEKAHRFYASLGEDPFGKKGQQYIVKHDPRPAVEKKDE